MFLINKKNLYTANNPALVIKLKLFYELVNIMVQWHKENLDCVVTTKL